MRTHYICLCIAISSGVVNATVQNDSGQDKPPYFYVKSYSMSDSGSVKSHSNPITTINYGCTYVHQNIYNSSFNGKINWNDSSSGTNSWLWLYNSVVNSGPGLIGLIAQTASDSTTWSWPESLWPQIPATTVSAWSNPTIGEQENGQGGYDTNGGVNYGNTNTTTNLLSVILEHCNINVSANYYTYDPSVYAMTSQWTTASETRNAQAVIKFNTGGKAVANQRNLWMFNASAWQPEPGNPQLNCYEYPLGFPLGYSQFLYDCLGGIPVVSPNIAIGSYGSLDANGNLYISLANNEEVDITPIVAGIPSYEFNINYYQEF
jgi:hypothetical protein